MKTTLLCASLCTVATVASAEPAKPAKPVGHYCNLEGFSPAARKRHRELVQELAASIVTWRELPDGYEFDFSGAFEGAGEWLDFDRRCCPTLDYDARFASHGGPASIRIAGTNGAKDFIREEFSPLFAKKP